MNALAVLNEIEDRLGWTQTKTLDTEPLTADTRKLLRLLNRVLQSITGMQDWPLLRKDGSILLIADQTSDLTAGAEEYVAIARDSDTMTVQNATFGEQIIGHALQVSGDEVVYRIKDVTSPTTLQLTETWASDDIVVGDERTYTIAMDQYALPQDFDRPLTDAQAFFAPYNIRPMSPDEFEQLVRNDPGITVGEPRQFTIFGMNAAQTSELLHVRPFPDEQRRLRFSYQMIHPTINSDNDKILFQNRYIAAIQEMVLQLALRDYEDDAKTQVVLADMLRAYNQQTANKGITGSRMVMRKTGRIRRSIQRAFANGGHRMDWGSWFDRADFHSLGE